MIVDEGDPGQQPIADGLRVRHKSPGLLKQGGSGRELPAGGEGNGDSGRGVLLSRFLRRSRVGESTLRPRLKCEPDRDGRDQECRGGREG